MDKVKETKLRLNISKNISGQLEGIVKAVVLGGSMGFGQYYSVTDKSDIDMVIVCDKDRARDLARTPYFSGEVNDDVLQMFGDETINLFWVTKEVDSVEVNSFIYETRGYENFCKLKGGIKGFISKKPEETQENYGFDGSLITFNRNVTPVEGGFLYEKPALANGRYVGAPPRDDFTRGFYIVSQERSYIDDLNEKVWQGILSQLIKEHGPNPNLDEVNILNSEFVYQTNPEKLPPKTIQRIKEETRERLEAIKSSE